MEPFDLEGGKGPIWDDDEPLGLGLPSDSQPPLFDTRDLGLDLDVPEASDALPASEFMALRLDSDQIGSSAVPSGGGGMAPAPGAAPGDDGEDPFKALEAAIEEDNPR